MKSLRQLSFTLLAALFMMTAAISAFADDDPPSRVARLKYISGDVSVQPGGVDDWVAANVNRPLTISDRVWADKDARAELHLGTSVMRMNSETSLALTNLTDETVQVALYQGTLSLRIKYLFRGEIYEVDTPNISFTITKSGEYRFDVDSNRDVTFVTVRGGEGVATGDGPAVRVKKNQQARFSDAKSLAHQVSSAPGRDGFDEWCKVRDSRESYVLAGRYVSPYVIGYEDLDGYGDWRYSLSYGNVWYPRIATVGWAPYRYGHWIWVPRWGWTWVDDAPWGFAPFHYGRWVYLSGSWGWCPGPRYVRPYYAPALVGWIGGSSWSIGISIGGGRHVGWFPLGYGEPYIPYYRVSRRYFNNVNISNTHITKVTNITNIYNTVYNTNNTNITTINNTTIDNSHTNIHNNNHDNVHNNNHDNIHIRYANMNVRDAVTRVPGDAMVKGKRANDARIDAKNLDEREVVFRPQVTPSRESVLGNRGERDAARPARDVAMRPVKEKLAPPKRVAFEEDRGAIGRDAAGANNGRGAEDRGRGNSNREAADVAAPTRESRFPHPPRAADQPDNGRPSADSQLNRGNSERGNRSPAGNNGVVTRDRDTGKSAGNNGATDFPANVPRPMRRGRDYEQPKATEAENREQAIPRPGMGNDGNNGNGRNDRQLDRQPADKVVPGATSGSNGTQQGNVPRPMRRGRDYEQPTPEASNRTQDVPRPGVGGWNNGNGSGGRQPDPQPAERNVGRGSNMSTGGTDMGNVPRPMRRGRDYEQPSPGVSNRGQDVPRPGVGGGSNGGGPNVDRGMREQSRPAMPESRPAPAPSPRSEVHSAPPARVESPRPERSQPAPREMSAPRQEAPRSVSPAPAPQSRGGGGEARGRSSGQERNSGDRGDRGKKND